MSIETGLGLTYRTDFPVPGINQPSQQFRDNFLTIKRAVENLHAATTQVGSPLILQTSVAGDGSIVHSISYPATGLALPTDEITPMADGRIRYNPTLKKVQFTVDGTWRSVGTENVVLSGDVSGEGLTGSTIPVTLAASGVSAGTYNHVVVDAKGRVTSGELLELTVIGDVEGYGSGTISLNLIEYTSPGTFGTVVVDAQGRVAMGLPTPYSYVVCMEQPANEANQVLFRYISAEDHYYEPDLSGWKVHVDVPPTQPVTVELLRSSLMIGSFIVQTSGYADTFQTTDNVQWKVQAGDIETIRLAGDADPNMKITITVLGYRLYEYWPE